MWVFLNNAMLSAVAHRNKPGHFMVRARLKGDLERVFPGATVSRTPSADYVYRCTVSKRKLKDAMEDAIDSIDYPNFKSSIKPADRARSTAYHGVWDVMMDAQRKAEPDSGYGGAAW